MPNKYYLTTPIYYVNGSPHLGHAYTNVAADISARFYRSLGYDVWFLTGTDEHGQKVAQAAEKQGMDPKSYVDTIVQQFYDFNQCLNISYDQFIRTTDDIHQRGAKALWKKVEKAGYIYKGMYQGYYAVRDEAYYTEDELQIKDGVRVAPTGAEVEFVEEESYFFKLSAFSDILLTYYDEHPDFIGPKSRFHEVYQFIKSGLKDLSISRSRITWGVPVPGNPVPEDSVPGNPVSGDTNHVMYVWFDALSNYITALGYPKDTKEFQTFWPTDLHLVGKDILRFHAVYWPAFLLAAQIPIPKRIFAHGWWLVNGEKMSKSLGNVIDPMDLVKKFGADYVRIYLLWSGSFSEDKNFTYEHFQAVINGKIVNEWGNLIHRTLSLIVKYCDSVIPNIHIDSLNRDGEMLLKDSDIKNHLQECIDQQKYGLYLKSVWKLVQRANQYIDKMAPWNLSKKPNDQQLLNSLAVVCVIIYRINLYLHPFMDQVGEKIFNMLNIPMDDRFIHRVNHAHINGIKIQKPTVLFPKIEY